MSSQNFNRFIAKLDLYLSQGSTNRLNVISRYSYCRTQPNYNEAQFLQEQQAIFHKWNREVEIFLNMDVGVYHYSFHYDLVKRSSMYPDGMPIAISNLILTYEAKLFALEDIILRLEERQQLMVRKEIAEREDEADVMYKVTLTPKTREIRINEFFLKRLNFESENDRVMGYLYAHPNQVVSIEELEGVDGNNGKLKKKLTEIVRDLGFEDDFRKVFFPVVQKNQIEFRNPVKKQYIYENKLPILTLPRNSMRSNVVE